MPDQNESHLPRVLVCGSRDWTQYGRAAGHKRNLAMLATHPALVIAFTTIAGGTPGTRHTLTNAYRRGIRVVIVTPDGAIADHTAPPA